MRLRRFFVLIREATIDNPKFLQVAISLWMSAELTSQILNIIFPHYTGWLR